MLLIEKAGTCSNINVKKGYKTSAATLGIRKELIQRDSLLLLFSKPPFAEQWTLMMLGNLTSYDKIKMKTQT